MSAYEIFQMRVTSTEFNDTKKDGPHGELFFFLMRRETIPIEAVRHKHVSTECLFSLHPAGRLASSRKQCPSEPGGRSNGSLGLDRAALRAQRQVTTHFFFASGASAEATPRGC